MDDPVKLTILVVLAAVLMTWLWLRRGSWAYFLSRAALTSSRQATESPSAALSIGTRLDARLFILSALLFLATRLVSLDDFPIYFFTDEAANTVLAADLVRNGFFDASGHFLPTYLPNSENLNLSVSVYLQVIPYIVFGRSVFVTRAVAVLMALSGTIAVGLMLKNVFRLRSAWLGIGLLAITPAWFLHSRTAFETSLFVALYAWFLYFYMRYLEGQAPALLPAVVFAGLAFYTYSAGQPVVLLTALLSLIVHARHHWRNHGIVLIGLLLTIVVSIPQIRFQANHPEQLNERLQGLDSFLVRPGMSIPDKVGRFVGEYAQGLSPFYWYKADNGRDLIRHRMEGYGNILWPTLPLAAWGIVLVLRRRHDAACQAILIALLAAPAGGALTEVHVTRVLVFVVPICLLSALGAAELLAPIMKRLGYARTAIGTFALVAVVSGLMLRDAVVNGPTWYSDYGLTGMQYGAREVFEASAAWLEQHPDSQVWIFPTWLNGSDMLRRFFAPDESRICLLNLDSFLDGHYEALNDALVVLSSADFRRVVESGQFAGVHLHETLFLPDGRVGFYFVTLGYATDLDVHLIAQRTAQLQKAEGQAAVWGVVASRPHTRPLTRGVCRRALRLNLATIVPTPLHTRSEQPLQART